MTEVSRRQFLTRGLAAGAGMMTIPSLLLEACGSSGSSGSSGGVAKTVIIGLNSDVPSLDPHRTTGWTTMLVTLTMGEHLVTEDLSQVGTGPPPLVPRLAQSYEVSPDGRTYTYHLREGVKFHDGTPFNSEAVEFNIRRQWDKSFKYYFPAAAAISFWDYQFLTKIATPDEHTVVLTLSQAWPEYIRMNVQSWGQQFMLSPTYVMKVGNEHVGSAPALTGPYKFERRVPGQLIEVVRNEDYWGPRPATDKFVFQVMADASTRVSSLTSGSVDIVENPLPWVSRGQIEGSGAKISTANCPNLVFISMNMRDPITKLQSVRQAIELAIDKEALGKSLYGEWSAAAGSMLPANSPSYDPNFKGREYNPEAAQKLLAEAGYPKGFETHALIEQEQLQMATIIQQDLAKVGIKLVLDNYDYVTYTGKETAGLKSPETMAITEWGMTADYWIDIMTRSTRLPPGGANWGWYQNPQVDKLLNLAEVNTSQSERTKYYRMVGQLLFEDASFIPLLNIKDPTGASSRVKGLTRPNEDWWNPVTVTT